MTTIPTTSNGTGTRNGRGEPVALPLEPSVVKMPWAESVKPLTRRVHVRLLQREKGRQRRR
eukprot:4841392-Prorocentrum_lima.AAC.1